MAPDHNRLHSRRVLTPRGGSGEAAAPLVISRRGLLGGMGATLAAGMLSGKARAGGFAVKRLTAATRVLEVNGRAARVFGLTGPD